MATRNIRPAVDLADPNDPTADQLQPAAQLPTYIDPDAAPVESSPADRIAALLSDVRDDDRAKVKLSRVRADARIEWCADYTPAEFEAGGFEMIRRDWGTGRYRIVLYGSGMNGSFGIRAREEINIAAPVATSPAAGHNANGLDAIARMLIDSQERQAQMIAQALQRPADVNPMAQLVQMATMFKELREAFGGNAPAPAKADPLNMIETMRAMREFAVELQTGKAPAQESDPQSDMLALAKDVMGMIVAARGTPAQAQPVQLAGPVPAVNPDMPAHVPPVAVPSGMADVQPADESEAAMLKVILRSYMDTLIKQAEANAPVLEVAQLVADKLPDILVPMLDLPDWFDKLAALDPRVIPHRAYITQVRDAAMPLLFESDNG